MRATAPLIADARKATITAVTKSITPNPAAAPTITCPANITTNNDPGNCSAVVTWAAPSASDNCPGVTTACSPASGSTFAEGTTTATLVYPGAISRLA